VEAPYQFSCFNKSAARRLPLRNLARGEPSGSAYLDRAFRGALRVARPLLEPEAMFILPPHTFHYFAPGLINRPPWAAPLPDVRFHQEVRNR
jgi:hypothetical protein